MSAIREVKEMLWDERNWFGKLLFLPAWPMMLFIVGLSDFLDWLANATRK